MTYGYGEQNDPGLFSTVLLHSTFFVNTTKYYRLMYFYDIFYSVFYYACVVLCILVALIRYIILLLKSRCNKTGLIDTVHTL